MSLLKNVNKNTTKTHVRIFTNLKKLIKKFDICSAE